MSLEGGDAASRIAHGILSQCLTSSLTLALAYVNNVYTNWRRTEGGRTEDSPGPINMGLLPGRPFGPGIATLSGVASDVVSGRASQIRSRNRNCRERFLQKTD